MVLVERSYPAPKSLATEALKKGGSYSKPDVVERLRRDFHDKCYICEVKPVDDPEVEHRLPHKGGMYPDRKFDWDNLFYSCGHCNTVKNKAKYDEGIIDCCRTDPEKRITQELVENEVIAMAIDPTDREACLTAELLREVFMSENPALRKFASAARLEKLQLRMNALCEKLSVYAEGECDAFTKATIGSMLRSMVSLRSTRSRRSTASTMHSMIMA